MNEAAPALTPMIPGSASGLRVTPCRIAPPRPRAAPTVTPRIVRGTRISRTTVWDADDGSASVSASQMTGSVIAREPIVMLKKHTTSSRPTSATRPRASRPRRARGAAAAGRRAGGAAVVIAGAVRAGGPVSSRWSGRST